jgi:membrane protease YdiL (CAAX protease family)
VSGVVVLALRLVGVRIPIGLGVLIRDAIFLATLAPLYRSGSLRTVDLGLRRVPGARSVGLVLLGLLAYGWFSVLWTSAVHPPPVRSPFLGIAHQSTIVIVLTGFAAAVSAPVVEEIFFRGLLYRSFRNRLGIGPACVIAGALFGLGHTDYPLLVRPELAFFGVVAALLYERTGSLLPGIAMHSFIDATGFEIGLTGNDRVVITVFLLFTIILLAHPPLRGLGRLLTGKPVFRPGGRPMSDSQGG